MGTVLEIVVSVFASGIGVAFLIVFTIRQRVRRSNRLVAGRTSPAPAAWLWSPRRAAVLHRRLRSCCQVALGVVTTTAAPDSPRGRWWRRTPAAPPGPFERIGQELVTRAVEIDARLVAADRLEGAWRRQAMAGLAQDVSALEDATRRMERLGRSWQTQTQVTAAPERPALGEQLDALEAALGALRPPPPGTEARRQID